MNGTKRTLLSGVFYNAIAKYSGIVISLAVMAVLSRLLTPEVFGVATIATVIITFFGIFSDLGIAPAVIQYKDLDRDELDGIFSFTCWTGVAMALLFFICSGAIASFYGSHELRPICRLLSVNLLFSSTNIVPNALILKNKRFRFIAGRTLFVQATVGAAAIAAAFSGAGVYALLVNPICSSIVLFAINLRQYPLRLRRTLGLRPLRRIFSFSAYQFLFNVLNYFTRNLDKLMIGKYMGLTPLGYYDKSYRLMMLPLQNITHVITPVMHPVFSDFQHDLQRLSASYLKVVRVLLFVGFPLSALLYFTSSELVLLFFGPQWTASVPVFRILSLTVGVQIVLSTSGSIFQAANSTRVMFWSGALSAVLNVAAILAGIFIFGTLEAVAGCIALSFAVNFVQSYLLMYRVTFRRSWGPFWRLFLSPLLLTALIAAALCGLQAVLPPSGLIVPLLAKGALALAIAAAYIQFGGVYDIRKAVADRLRSRRRNPDSPRTNTND